MNRIADRYSLLLLPGSIIVLDYSFTYHKLIIFWIILACAFGSGEGFAIGEMGLIGIA
jgi:hypothetical protein